MKWTERIVMLLIVFVLIGGTTWGYFAVMHERAQVREAVARGEFQIPDEEIQEQVDNEEVADWQAIYPNTIQLTIADMSVQASVADTLTKRIKGLSDTPFLPDHVVKLFAFGVPGSHSIWMKDMNYALDIIWVAKEGEIVHIEKEVSPDSFPTSFASPTPAWFVIEANAGFVDRNEIKIGDEVVIPTP
jgi:uncharacterized membrane protein (UPF0127 family)